jgi:hypothetical protein
MRFYNEVLSRTVEVRQSNFDDVRVLVSEDFRFPSIDGHRKGLVLRIPKPSKVRDGFLLNGVVLENNEIGRDLLMSVLMSSIEHLGVHSIVSDFSVYDQWRKAKEFNLACFVIDLIEDLCVKCYIKTNLQGLLRRIALVNAISYTLITTPSQVNSKQALIQSALLCHTIAGRYKYLLPFGLKKDLLSILAELRAFEKYLTASSFTLTRSQKAEGVNNLKIQLADSIYGRLVKHGITRNTVCLVYSDRHGMAEERASSVIDVDETIQMLADTCRALGLQLKKMPDEETIKTEFSKESSTVLYDLASEHHWKERMVQRYTRLAKEVEFDEITFPAEDYANYYRSYSKYRGTIRRIIDYISILKNDIDQNANQQIGLADLQEAIQVLASERMNNNIFIRDEYLRKEEAWCILLDTSASLTNFSITARDTALCLAEVAKEIMPGKGNWGLYAFSNNFVIVKDIEEEYNANVKARIGGLHRGGLSHIPDALKLGARILVSSGKEQMYLFLISDGLPSGYPGVEEKLRKDLKHIINAGISFIPIGVGSNGMQRYMRNASILVETPLHLMSKFVRMYFEMSHL